LDVYDVPNAPINSIQEVFNDPQVKHMGIPKQIDHPKMGKSNLIGSPINLSDTPAQFFRPAPLLGEHTDEILERLGYDGDAIKDLRASGVV
jgi:crotonobetainyl-CoA:carnitine CoA-transferase CaiB-like acyl-CoA transferase